MTIKSEIQSLSPNALIEMFELDTTSFAGGGVSRFHAGTNSLRGNITWQSNEYLAAPIEAEGFGMTTKGVLPRPKIRIVNVDGMFSSLVRENNDLVGCTVIRKRTFYQYLDAVNFPGGVNPTADPFQHLPDELWFVERKLSENRYQIEWELSSALDIQSVMLPSREVIQNSCTWRYKGPECEYSGTNYFDSNDAPTDSAHDFCGKRLGSCRKRFTGDQSVPFGGFPGAMRYAF